MSKQPLALGIDIGTSGVRAAVLSLDGQEQAYSEAAMSEFGEDRRDPSIWRAALAAALERLFAKVDASRIEALSVDGTSGTVMALDADGAPIGGGLMYNDAVDDPAIPTAIAEIAPRESAAHGASSGLARAIALQSRPGTVRIAHQADWIAELIAGAPLGSDESNALKTGYDPIARMWPDWLDATPMRRELLPRVAPAGTQTGTASGAFGVPKGAAIVAGCTDGCASFLATGASEPGDGVTALGSTLTIKLLSDKPVFAPEYGIYSHRIEDMWLPGGASNSGGAALAAIFSADELSALSLQIDPSAPSGFDYYPLPGVGERFPLNAPDMQPRIKPRPDDDAAYLHGLLEGVANIEALGYRRLSELGAPPLKTVRSVGGGAANETWTQIRTRALGVETAPPLSTNAAAGVARLALRRLQDVEKTTV